MKNEVNTMGKYDIRCIDKNKKFKIIGQGNTAEIYLYDNDRVLKLFRKGIPFEFVEREYEVTKLISSDLKNVPRVFDIVLYKELYGIIYERIKGKDMIKEMLSNLHKIKTYSKSLAMLHSSIHRINTNIQRSVKEKLHADIDSVKELSKLEKKKIKSYLDSLPEGNCLCHFDFHPGNVMVQDKSLFVIDWMTVCIGDPNADVARTTILMQFGEIPNINHFIKMVIHIFEKRISNFYYEEYKRLTGVSDLEVEQWKLPIAAARLVEWISDSEKAKLLIFIRKELLLINESQS